MPRDERDTGSGLAPSVESAWQRRSFRWEQAAAKKAAKRSTKRSTRKKRRGRAAPKPKPVRVHGVAGAGSAGRTQPGAGGTAGSAGQVAHTASAHAGSPAAAWILAGSGTGGTLTGYDGLDRLPGISGVLLDLVGEGHIGLSHALSAWQREQERVTNRTWRRPGGLARMGGL